MANFNSSLGNFVQQRKGLAASPTEPNSKNKLGKLGSFLQERNPERAYKPFEVKAPAKSPKAPEPQEIVKPEEQQVSKIGFFQKIKDAVIGAVKSNFGIGLPGLKIEQQQEIEKKATEFAVEVARSVPRSGVSTYLTATGQKEITPGAGDDNLISRAERILLGDEKIKDFQGTGEETISGFGGSEKIAKNYGFAAGAALAALDLIPGVPKKKIAETLAKETSEKVIKKTLQEKVFKDLSDDTASALAKRLSTVNNEKDVQGVLDYFTKVDQKQIGLSDTYYHASPVTGIKEFRASTDGQLGAGVYLSKNKGSAMTASAMQGDGNLADIGVYSVKINTDKIYKTEFDYLEPEEITKLKKQGYEGIETPAETLVFNPKKLQILKEELPGQVSPALSSEAKIVAGQTRASNVPTQTEIKNRAQMAEGKSDLYTQRKEKLDRVFGTKAPQATDEVLNEIRGAIHSGDLEGAKALHTSLSDDFTLPKFEKIEDEVTTFTKQALSDVSDDVGQTVKPGYENVVRKMTQFLIKKGEAVSKEGTLYREHIPESIFGQSSDEVATALGMTESEFMAKITKGIEMRGERSVRATIRQNNQFTKQGATLSRAAREIQKLDKSISERKEFNKYFNPVRKDGQLVAVSAEATPETISKIGQRMIKDKEVETAAEFNEWRSALYASTGTRTVSETIDDLARMIQESTNKAYRDKNPITVKEKVGILDYLRTPDRVLKKIGLGPESESLRKAYENYLTELPKEINKITAWAKQVSPAANERIFRYLDGQGGPLTNPTEVKVAKEIQAYFQQWANKLDLPADKRITNYITHIFDPDFVKKEFDPEIAKMIRDRIPGSVYDPFVEQRLGKLGYVEDTWQALDAYAKRAIRKVNMDPVLKQIKQKADILEESQYSYLKSFIDRVNLRPTKIDSLIDNTIKQMVGYRFGQRPVIRITQKLRQAVYRGTLGLNIGSAIRNLTQGANTYAKLGEEFTIKGYGKMVKAFLTRDDELFRVGALQSDLIEDRTFSATKKAWEKFDKGLWVFFDAAEKINRGAAYYGAKAKYLAKNKNANEEEAIEYAKKIVRDTQFTFGSIDTPQLLQSDLAKTILQFQSYNLKQAEFLTEMVKNKEIAGLVRYAGAGTVAFFTIGQLFGMKPTDMIPFYSYFSGEGQSKFGETPPIALAKEIAGGIVGAKGDYGEDVSVEDRIKRIGAKLIPFIPAGVQGKKTIEGYLAAQQGYSETAKGRVRFPVDQSPVNTLRTMIFGQYSSSNAREYFNEDKNPLGEEQSKVFKELNPEEREEYLQLLARQKEITEEDKAVKQEAENTYSELKGKSSDAIKSKLLDLVKNNPELLDKLMDIMEEKALGLSHSDKLIKNLGVENGERAKYIWSKIQKKESGKEKGEYIADLYRKKIITGEIVNQLAIIAAQ